MMTVRIRQVSESRHRPLGVSRTSKTPLSLFLANRGYKVANLPLVPKTHIPDQIYQVDPKKIFGLTNDPSILNNIRRERMISYGLNPDTTYSNMDNIQAELDFAMELYKSSAARSSTLPTSRLKKPRLSSWKVSKKTKNDFA